MKSISFCFLLASTAFSMCDDIERALTAIVKQTPEFRPNTPPPGSTVVTSSASVRTSHDGLTKTITGLASIEDIEQLHPLHTTAGKIITIHIPGNKLGVVQIITQVPHQG